MYPTRLNLLSPEKRSYLQRIIFFQFIKNSLESLVFVLALSGIILLGAQWVLEGYFNDISAGLLAGTSRQAEKNAQINQVNATLTQIDALQQLYTLWTPILIPLSAALPPGVILDGLTLDATTAAYHLSGRASTRAELLALKNNLQTLPFIAAVTIPLSQLTEKENVTFSITASLTP